MVESVNKIVIIDDDDSIRNTLSIYFKNQGFSIFSASNGTDGIKLVEDELPNLVITDLKMPDSDGIEILEKIKTLDNDIQVIIMTAHDEITSTIKAMQKGAFDYLQKPLNFHELKIKVLKALETQKISQRLAEYIMEDSAEYQLEKNLVGRTPPMMEIFKFIGHLSNNKITVLLQGESGTGKELIARIIHFSGITAKHPFVAVNCTALTESLLESELFGHVKGAFTGATNDKKGKFELAGEGTIFLDEISELSPNIQVKLLRVLQEREFEKVGGEHVIPMNARVITASNRILNELVEQGKFREDLYYRLKVFTIEVPPLRDRKEDIPLIVVHLLKKINKQLHKNIRKISYEALEKLQTYDWVGNVRELENTLTQAIVLAKGDVLEKDDIFIQKIEKVNSNVFESPTVTLDEVEKKYIHQVLENLNWNKERACRVLGISKPTLYQKIKKYNLEPTKE